MYHQLERPEQLLSLGRAVADEGEFRDWINDVHQGFGESLHDGLQCRPPYPLPGLRELVRDGRLDQVRRLRNYHFHFNPGADDEAVVGAICHRLAGVKLIKAEDAAGWSRLQFGLLRDVVALLTDVCAALHALPVPQAAELVAAFPRMEGYS